MRNTLAYATLASLLAVGCAGSAPLTRAVAPEPMQEDRTVEKIEIEYRAWLAAQPRTETAEAIVRIHPVADPDSFSVSHLEDEDARLNSLRRELKEVSEEIREMNNQQSLGATIGNHRYDSLLGIQDEIGKAFRQRRKELEELSREMKERVFVSAQAEMTARLSEIDGVERVEARADLHYEYLAVRATVDATLALLERDDVVSIALENVPVSGRRGVYWTRPMEEYRGRWDEYKGVIEDPNYWKWLLEQPRTAMVEAIIRFPPADDPPYVQLHHRENNDELLTSIRKESRHTYEQIKVLEEAPWPAGASNEEGTEEQLETLRAHREEIGVERRKRKQELYAQHHEMIRQRYVAARPEMIAKLSAVEGVEWAGAPPNLNYAYLAVRATVEAIFGLRNRDDVSSLSLPHVRSSGRPGRGIPAAGDGRQGR